MENLEPKRFVSRGGEKLEAALQGFGLEPAEMVCADLGCNVGGFTDCLLQHSAARVYAVDTGYGELAWKLRKDPRVVAMERTNALRVELPEPVALVCIDVGWTRQHLILPAALAMLDTDGQIVTLIKPHYEVGPAGLRHGVLPADRAAEVLAAVHRRLAECGISLHQTMESPLRGRKGNREFFGLVRR